MISDQLDKTLQRAKDFAEKFNHEYMTIDFAHCVCPSGVCYS